MADTVISTEVVIAGFAALGGAIVWLAHKWDAGNTRCEERSNLLHRELGSLRDWTQSRSGMRFAMRTRRAAFFPRSLLTSASIVVLSIYPLYSARGPGLSDSIR